MKSKFLIGALLLSMTTFASAKDDYFYFWADSYKTHLGVDGTAFVLLNLKTSKTNKFDISVNEKVVALDYPVFADEITQFPITISKKFTDGDNREYAWADTRQDQYIQKQDKYIKIAPKINMYEADLPFGTTRIQGTIQVTCGSAPTTI